MNVQALIPALVCGVLAGVSSPLQGQTCETWLQQFGTTDLGGPIHDAVVFDDGDGDAVYAVGEFGDTANGAVPIGGVAVWRDGRWQPLGDGGAEPPFEVRSIEIFDDGRGDAVYVAGFFETVDGFTMNSIARWDGRLWEAVGGGVLAQEDPEYPGVISAMTVFDDGNGPQLYAIGDFVRSGNAEAQGFARWNGVAWEALENNLGNGAHDAFIVYDLETFDDGSGPALYAGGTFNTNDGHLTTGVARWNGVNWEPLPQPIPLVNSEDGVRDLLVADFGSGDSLFVAGEIRGDIDGETTDGVLEWTGSQWQAVGTGLGVDSGLPKIYSLALTSFEDGPVLYAGGQYNATPTGGGKNISRWDGSTWAPLGFGLQNAVTKVLQGDLGRGERLLALGGFSGSVYVHSPDFIAWDGTDWEGVSNGFYDRQVVGVTFFEDDIGPAMFVGTTLSNHYIARYDEFGWMGYPDVRQSASAFNVIDLGSGDRLYAAFGNGGVGEIAVGVLDGASWERVGDNYLNNGVLDVEPFDDGDGTTIVAAGGFTGTWQTITARASVLIDGEWLEMPGITRVVRDWVVFDDGSGEAIYAAGDFDTLNGEPYNGVLRWNGSAWEKLADGLNWSANALAVYDSGSGAELYAGGRFFLPGDNGNVVGVARWTGTDWEPVGDGLGTGAWVYDLLVYDDGTGSKLYAGGGFNTADGQPARGIARWDGSGWEPVGTGTGVNTGGILSMETFDDGSGTRLAVGGTFTSIDGVLAERLAVWDGTSWDALGGVDGTVYALKVFDDGNGELLYAGGSFDFADNQTARGIAVWNGITWGPVGVLDNRNGPDVYALEVVNGDSGPRLYAGGKFNSADGLPVQNSAAWDGMEWSAALQADNNVRSLVAMQYQGQEVLGAGGDFSLIGGEAFSGVAQLSTLTGEWEPLAGGGLTGSVYALLRVIEGGQPYLYAGGNFLEPGARVARYDGTQWERLGDGLNASVLDLELFDDGSGPAVYAAGDFTDSGGVSMFRIAKWNGAAWEPVGTGIDDGLVYDLTVHDSTDGKWLVASGSFTSVGGVMANGVAAWDGAAWIPLDSGLNGTGFEAASAPDTDEPLLIVVGDFSVAGDTVAGSIAAWGTCPPEPCVADFNNDDNVNTLDVLAFLNAWNVGDMSADINGDGDVNTLDVLAFLNAWTTGCP